MQKKLDMTTLEAKKRLLTCPGNTILEYLTHQQISEIELAKCIGISGIELKELIEGTVPIMPNMAATLEKTLGSSTTFWLNLEKQYQAKKAEIHSLEKRSELI